MAKDEVTMDEFVAHLDKLRERICADDIISDDIKELSWAVATLAKTIQFHEQWLAELLNRPAGRTVTINYRG